MLRVLPQLCPLESSLPHLRAFQGGKDLSKVKPVFKSVPLQIYFEIAAEKWRKIQNVAGEERF